MQKIFLLLVGFVILCADINAQQITSKPGANKSPYKTINDDTYVNATDFYEGLAAVKVNNAWGFIDSSGKIVIQPQFNPYQAQFYAYFSEGLVAINMTSAQKSGIAGNDPVGTRWGFADKTGKVVIKPQFEGNYYAPPHFTNGLAVIGGNFIGTTVATFGLNVKYGYINKEGVFAIPQKFDEAYDFSDDLASVKVGSKYGFIDKTGRMVIPPMYDAPGFFIDGIAIVELDQASFVIDKNNKKVIDKSFQGLSTFSEGLARFESNGKAGFIDKKGNVKIKPTLFFSTERSKRLMYFSEGASPIEVEKNVGNDVNGRTLHKFGYINQDGKTIIEPQFDFAGPFRNGIAVVSLNSNFGYIDKKGKFLIPPVFANAGYFINGIARASGGGAFGDYRYRFIKLN